MVVTLTAKVHALRGNGKLFESMTLSFPAMGPGVGTSGPEVGRPMHKHRLQGRSGEERSSAIPR